MKPGFLQLSTAVSTLLILFNFALPLSFASEELPAGGLLGTADSDSSKTTEDEFDIFDRPANKTTSSVPPGQPLSPQAQELANWLKLSSLMARVKTMHTEYRRSHDKDSRLDILILQFRLARKIQDAALQLEETFANLDGDLAQTNMLLAYASTKHDRTLLLTNVATFTGSGTFGILDSSIRLGGGAASDIFGILSSATAVGLPLLSLRTPKYGNPRKNQPRLNMIAPVFEMKSNGEGYEPVVWQYINSVPPNSVSQKTRREMLIDSWKAYRGFGKETGMSRQETIREIIDAPSKSNKLTIDALKTRAELLIDIRALVQAMYRDLAELDNAVEYL